MIEVWKPVIGYKGLYEVSSLGQVRSLHRILCDGRRWRGRVLTHATQRNGYCQVNLLHNGVQSKRTVHRLVLEAFVGPCPEGMEACHNDGIRDNNHLSNLRWDTKKSNQADRIKHGTDCRGERHGRTSLCNLDVWLIRNIHCQQYKLAEFFGVSRSRISEIRSRKTWTHVV
jgi:hypothetical protein